MIKYFDNTFELGKDDCWTLVCRIFKDEHGLTLPEFPFVNDSQDRAYEEFKSNIELDKVQKAQKGCIIVFRSGRCKWHCGYAVNHRQYIHKTRERVTITDIPKNAEIYKVLNVRTN